MAHTPELLRFSTAGSVDDGKSTLIGRLLYDSKSIFEDQMAALKSATERRGEQGINLALLTDGLKAEREQGITIDVAYRYFATPRRRFIIADTPGHIQYTRNMVTGASTANVALILVDARQGLVEQTRRHALIASLLQIPHLAVCVNKMDLIDYSEGVFEEICAQFSEFASKLEIKDIQFIPLSALHGDNVVEKSTLMPWYGGTTLLYYLEHVHISSDHNLIDCRFPVQLVIRPNTDAFHDYRGYAGRVAGGIFKKGDSIVALPSGFASKIAKIEGPNGEQEQAFSAQSVTLLLEDDLDISRGDMLVRPNNMPRVAQDLDLMLCWFHENPLRPEGKYILRHCTQESRCVIKNVLYKMDINSLHRIQEDVQIRMNDVARVQIRCTKPLFFDPYSSNRTTGSVILIDEATYATVAAGMII